MLLRVNGLLDYADKVFICGFCKTISMWVLLRWVFKQNTILQGKIIKFKRSKLSYFIKHKWYHNAKAWDHVLLEEANDFLAIHFLKWNYFCPLCEVISSCQDVAVPFHDCGKISLMMSTPHCWNGSVTIIGCSKAVKLRVLSANRWNTRHL